MKNKIKSLFLLSIVFVMVYWSSCTPDEVVQPPYKPDCAVLYPEYNGTVDTSVFYFEWCSIGAATKYRIQATKTFQAGEPFLYDTIVEGMTVKSTRIFYSSADPSLYREGTPFEWGNSYEWRVAPIINGVQGDWSEIYPFKTWDARDKFVGTYSANKYIYEYTLFGQPYFKENLGTGQIKIEKVEGSDKILVSEIGGNNLTQELNNSGASNGYFLWMKIYNVYPNTAVFYPQTDSFSVFFMTNPADSLAWGYYFGGHY
jgi:hypothetical protein